MLGGESRHTDGYGQAALNPWQGINAAFLFTWSVDHEAMTIPAAPTSLLYTNAIGFKCPNGEPVNIQYLNQHLKKSPVGSWWKEITLILNNVIVHAEVKRPTNWRRTSMTDIEPLYITGFYYGLNGLGEASLI